MADDRLLQPHGLRSIFAKSKTTPPENLYREIALHVAAEDIGPKATPPKATPMANTGAKGFAAIMKARQRQMMEEFSQLADDLNGAFDEQDKLKEAGKSQVAEIKATSAELREVLGLKND